MKAALRAQTRGAPPLSFTPVTGGLLQRKCACGGTAGLNGECESCSKKKLQRPSENLIRSSISHPPSSVSEVPPIVHEVLGSPGQPLDAETRAFMEPRFGHDFSRVRVHADARAGQSARAVSALAYTVGRDIVFGIQQYAPFTSSGQRLMVHELAHTIQQGGSPMLMNSALQMGGRNDVYEQEASRFTDQLLAVKPHAAASDQRDVPPVAIPSLRGGPCQIARDLATPEDGPVTPQLPTPQDNAAIARSEGPDCSRTLGRGRSLPWPTTPFHAERGFATIPSNNESEDWLLTGSTVTIGIIGRWEEQIADPTYRPSQHRADSPRYNLLFDGWVDACNPRREGRQASSVQSNDLAIGMRHSIRLQRLLPGRYRLHISPSTRSPERNRSLTGACEVTD